MDTLPHNSEEPIAPNRAALAFDDDTVDRIRAIVRDEVSRALFGHTTMAHWVSVKDMVPHMPPGARSEATVRRWIHLNLIPARKLGRRWSIDRAEAFRLFAGEFDAKERVRGFITRWDTARKALRRNAQLREARSLKGRR